MGAIDPGHFLSETPKERPCHHCGCKQFKTWSKNHILLLHWKIDPGLAVNELCLGQRLSETTFICRSCGHWLSPDTHYIECPACDRFHNARIWQNAGFGNWFGITCPDCAAPIPCVSNFTSLLILKLISPVTWVLKRIGIPNLENHKLATIKRVRASRYKHYFEKGR